MFSFGNSSRRNSRTKSSPKQRDTWGTRRTRGFEDLEQRRLLSIVSWTSTSSGYWDVASNWSGDAVPTSANDVQITQPGVTVTVRSGAQAANSITTGGSDPIIVSGGSLNVVTTATLGSSLTLSGGTLVGGTWSAGSGTQLTATASSTLTGVTLAGLLSINDNVTVTVNQGLTLENGTVQFNGYNYYNGNSYAEVATLLLAGTGTQTLGVAPGSTGQVVFAGSQSGSYYLLQVDVLDSNAGPLVLGAGISVTCGSGPSNIGGTLGNSSEPLTINGTVTASGSQPISVTGSSVTNNGPGSGSASLQANGDSLTVSNLQSNAGGMAASAGGTLTVSNLQSNAGGITATGGSALTLNGVWQNGGTITATGGTLSLGNGSNAWSNTGTITATSGTLNTGGTWSNTGSITTTNSTLNLGGTFSTPAAAAISYSGDTVNITGSLSNTGQTMMLASGNTWNLAGGTITGGSLSVASGVQLNATASSTLTGVTLAGLLSINDNVTVTVNQGLTLENGTVQFNGYNYYNGNSYAEVATLLLAGTGTQTLGVAPGSTGQVVFAGSQSGSYYLLQVDVLDSNAGPLVLGAGISVTCGSGPSNIGGTLGNSSEPLTINGTVTASGSQPISVTGSSVTNNGPGSGSASLQANGDSLTVSNLQSNAGGMAATAGGAVTLNGAWQNTGSISVTSSTLNTGGTWSDTGTITATNSTLNLGGTFTTPVISSSSGTVNLTGTLNNVGNTLTLSQSWYLLGGTINGGTVAASGGPELACTSSGGTLNGVTVNGPLDLTATEANAAVTNGLTLNGTATLGYEAHLYFNGGSQTLGGTGTVVFNNQQWQGLIAAANGMTLTIGAGITIHGGNNQGSNSPDSVIGYSGSIWGGGSNVSIINLGTISADTSGMSISINPQGSGTFSNQGTLSASNGGNLYVNSLAGNLGTANLSGSGTGLTLGGNYVVNQSLVVPAGTTLNLGYTWSNTATITATSSTLNLSGTWSNAGTITVSNCTLNSSGTWSSTGTITVANSTLNLSGTVTTAMIAALSCSSGTVNLTGTLNNVGNTLTLSQSWYLLGGTINGGTVAASGGPELACTSSGGTLNGVTVNGPLDLTATEANAAVTNGLTLNGTATLGYEAHLYFNGGSQTLGGTGTVVFNNQQWQGLIAAANGMTLTIGAGITIHGGNNQGSNSPDSVIGYSGSIWGGGSNVSIINLGTISADTSGMSISINPQGSGTFSNQGTLSASNGGNLYVNSLAGNLGTANLSGSGTSMTLGGNYVVNQGLAASTGATLNLGGTWSNTGTMTATNSTLNLGGTFTTPVISSSSGTVNLTGTLNNVGNTLTLSQSWYLLGGTINGGTVAASGGPELACTSSGGTLNGVTVNGPLDLTATEANAAVTNGLTLNGTATLGYEAHLYFNGGSQTLGGTGTVVFNNQQWQGLIAAANGMTLTIGAGITIHGGNNQGSNSPDSVIGYSGSIWGGGSNVSIINLGAISADTSGMSISINPQGSGTFSNQGTLSASNGGNLYVNSLAGNLGTANLSGSGTSMTLGGNYVVNQGLAASAGATLNLGGTWSNTGTMTATNSTLNLGGTFTTPVISSSSGTVNLTGTLNNVGNTLTLSQSWYLLGGTINGGTVAASGGPELACTSSGGTLNGVTVNGPLDLTATEANAAVTNGLTLNGTATLGYEAHLYFNGGSQTLGGTGTVVFNNQQWQGLIAAANGMTLTIGAGITIHGGNNQGSNSPDSVIGYSGSIWGGGSNVSIINLGAISADTSGMSISINPHGSGAFSNQGTLSASNGGTLYGNGTWTNAGTVQAQTGGTFSAGSTPTNYVSGTLTGGTWNVFASSTLYVPLGSGISTDAANILLDGLNSNFYNGTSGTTNALAAIATIAGAGSFTVQDGRTFTTTGSLTNNGTLNVGGTLNVTGTYTEAAAATLIEQIGGTQAGQFGSLAATGAATLAGTLGVDLTGGFQPGQYGSTSFLSAASVTGQFSSVVNITPGSAYSFSAYYSSKTVNVVVTVVPFVDLVVTQEQGPSQLVAGLPGSVTWTVTNEGNTATAVAWQDAVYLSANGQVSGATLLATEPEGSTPLAANGNYQATATFTVAVGTSAGTYSLLVDANVSQTQTESTYSNNISAVNVPLLPPQPDLTVTGLSVSPASGLQSGGSLSVNWNDANSGLGAVSSSFFDQVQIVNTTTGQTLATATVSYNESSRGPLAAGGSAAQQYTFQLPNGAAGVGSLSITVTNDIYNQVTKFNSNGTPETSSTATLTTTSTLAPYPDLHASAVAVDASSVLQSGGTVTVDWNDSNVGDGTASGIWSDQITVVNTTTGQTLVNTNQTYAGNSIFAGGNTPRSYSFTLPNGAAGVGTLSITITADMGGSLLEYNSSGAIDTNRSANITAQATLGFYPDLHAAALVVAASSVLQSDGTVTVDWNDSNVGDATASGSWSDQITVVNTTTDQTLVNTDQTYGSRSILAGGSTPRSYSFTLPNGAAGVGQLSITVTADAGGSLLDFNSSGLIDTNRSATIITAPTTLAHYPDLTAQNIATTAVNPLPGSQILVTWTDFNQGNAGASGSWIDYVFLANNSSGANAQFLQSFSYSGTVPQQTGVAQSATVTLPQLASGNCWLVVQTGISASFFDTNSQPTAVSAGSFSIAPALLVSLSSHSTLENGGPISGSVSRSGTTAGPLSVTLSSSDLTCAVIDAGDLPSVTIPAGQSSAPFLVDPVNESLYQPPQVVTISATATGYVPGAGQLTVTNTNTPALTLSIATTPPTSPVEFDESTGAGAAVATVTRNTLDDSAPLSVTIASSNPVLATAGDVTIPAEAASATFTITALVDGQITGPRSVVFSASAAGFNGSTANVLVVDDEIPSLSLSIPVARVADNAASPVQAVVTSSVPVSTNLRVALESSNSQALSVPQYVVISQGQTSAIVLLSPVYSSLVEGPRTVTVTAYPVDTLTGQPLDTGDTSGQITVTDSNSPLLSVTLANETIFKGQGTTGTVTINEVLNQPLTVELTTTNPEAIIPASVTVAAGSLSQTFAVTSLNGGVYTGNQTGQITASVSDNSFQPGSQVVNITDVDLPDLAVTGITFPGGAAGVTDQKNFQVAYTVANQGLVGATGPWTDQVYLVSGAGATLLGSFTQAGLAMGASYSNTVEFTLPGMVGSYQVQVQCDTGESVSPPDSNRSNNILLSAPITVTAAYGGTVQAVPSQAGPAATIALSGQAVSNTSGLPVPNAPLSVRILTNGLSQVLDEITNSSGNWSDTFVANQPGHYSISAAYPGAAYPAEQAGVDILGMSFSDAGSPSCNLTPNVPLVGTIGLSNASNVALTDLQATVNLGSPPVPINVSIAWLDSQGNPLSAPVALPGGGSVQVQYALTATQPVRLVGQIGLNVSSSQGVTTAVPIGFRIVPLAANLVARPANLQVGILQGAQQFVSFSVTNNGSAPSGAIAVSLPANAPPWLALASSATIPSLDPGGTATVTLQLTPSDSLLPTQVSGSVALNAANGASLSEPFTIQVTSEQTGGLAGTVVDETATNGTAGSQLSGATITLTDPYTNQVVATATSDANGAFSFANIVEGTYQLNASAPGHLPVQQPVVIAAGITNRITDAQGNVQPIFLPLSLVTYTWTVVPTQIQDNYQIVLQANFLTDVPVPNVVVDKPFICPLVPMGGATQFDLNLTNEGLVQTNDLQWSIPANQYYTITPEVTDLPVLPAQSQQVARLTITPNAGDYPGEPGATCPIIISLLYSYDAGGPRWRTVDVTVYPFLVSAASYQAIANDWATGSPPLSVEQQDLYSATQDFQNTVLTDAAGDLASKQELFLATFANGITGSLSETTGTLFQMLTNFCELSAPPISVGGGGGGGGGEGEGNVVGGSSSYGGSAATPYLAPAPTMVIPATPAVPATVTIALDQTAVLTRNAFLGTLAIDNSNSSPLTDIQVTLDIRQHVPPNGGSLEANDDFFVEQPVLTGLTAVDGTGTLAADSSGTAQYTIIPTQDVASGGPTEYRISGTLQYVTLVPSGGEYPEEQTIDVPLLPAAITVYPNPSLVVNYFLQRDVDGDDPFTPQIEPSVPFYLGVQVTNVGQGAANNFSITSAQPQIVDNRTGLLINFQIIGTQVGNQQIQNGSLTTDFGDIEPGQTATADFEMLSSLQGQFTGYNATFANDDLLGGQETSLIDSVTVHNLIHCVEAGYVGNPASAPVQDDGIKDFLVDDASSTGDTPDTLYLSDGTTAPVSQATSPVLTQVDPQTWTLTVSAPAGWSCIQFADPTNGQMVLDSVMRSDGLQLLVGENAWTTDRTFNSDGSVTTENLVHILDYNAGTVAYTLHFVPNADGPTIAAIQTVKPTTTSQPPATIDVTFSEPIDLATFNYQALNLTYSGGSANLITSAVTISPVSGSTYCVNGLDGLQTADGTYTLTVDADGVTDLSGNSGYGSLGTTWTLDTHDTTVTVENVTTPRNTAVAAVTVVFSAPINPATFSYQALSLQQNGGANLITSAVAVTPTDATNASFSITGLAALQDGDGDYVLAVNPAGISDANGNSVGGGDSTSWQLDTATPVIVSLQTPATNPRNIVVPSLDVTFSQAVNPATFALGDVTLTGVGPGIAARNLIAGDNRVQITEVTPTVYEISGFNWVSGQDGTYTLTVLGAGIQDAAGDTFSNNVSSSWSMIVTPPAPPSALAINSDPPPTSWGEAQVYNGNVVFSGQLSEPGLRVALYDETTDTDLGDAIVTGQTFSRQLVLTAGDHQIRATAIDAAGNTSAAEYDIFVNLQSPTITRLEPISSPQTAAVSVEDVTFSKELDLASFNYQALTLTRGNDPINLITSAVTVTKVTGTDSEYQISGLAALTAPPSSGTATYSLTVDAASVQDSGGNPGNGQQTVTWTVNPAAITTTTSVVSKASNGSVYGQTVTLVATVSATNPAAGTPSGTVQFEIDGKDVGAPAAVANGTASIVVPGLNAANYEIAATYSSDSVDCSGSSGSCVLQVSPAPVLLALQSNLGWGLAGQELSIVAIASTSALLTPDGTLTFYDNGVMLNSQSLAVADGQDEAACDTTTLSVGKHLITVGYTSASGNFAMTSASPVLTEIVFPADATVLTVLNTSSDPSVVGSLPWAVAQADASNAATVITFATGAGQAFATQQTIVLEVTLDVSDTNPVEIAGPSWGVTLVGDYRQSRFPILSVAQDAVLGILGVNIGTQSPGADGDLQVAGALDVLEPVANLGSAVSVTGDGTIDLGGQTVTADTFTLTSGSLIDGTVGSGARTVDSGTVGANLTGSGGLVKEGPGTVFVSGNNDLSGGVQVLAGSLVFTAAGSLPSGSSLMVGADASSLFGGNMVATAEGQAETPSGIGFQPGEIGGQAAPVSAPVVASPNTVAPVGNAEHPLAGHDVPISAQAPPSCKAVEGVPYRRATPTVGPAQAHDAVFQSLDGINSAEDKEAAAIWVLDGSWFGAPSQRKHDAIESAVDAAMAMLERDEG